MLRLLCTSFGKVWVDFVFIEQTSIVMSSSVNVDSDKSVTRSVTVGDLQAVVIPVVTIICSAVLATVIAIAVTRILNGKSAQASQ